GLVRARPARRPRPIRRPGPGRGSGHRRGAGGGAAGGDRGERRHGEGGLVVARDDQEDAARPGSGHAPAHPHRLSRRLGRSESALPGGRVPGAVRRGADLLLQLTDAPLPARAADRRRDGTVHRRGAYLPALSDVIFMVDGTSFMGLGGPNLVKGATGQSVDAETLGGAATHTSTSAVAHYRAQNDTECLERVREYLARLPAAARAAPAAQAPKRDPQDLYDLLPGDHRMSYDARAVLECLLDAGTLDEFQPA